MIELGSWSIDATQPVIDQPIAIIDITVSSGKVLFVESPMFEEKRSWGKQAGRCNGRIITGHHSIGEIAEMPVRQKFESWTRHSIVVTMDDPSMLNAPIRIEQTGTDSSHPRQPSVTHHAAEPFRISHFSMVIEK